MEYWEDNTPPGEMYEAGMYFAGYDACWLGGKISGWEEEAWKLGFEDAIGDRQLMSYVEMEEAIKKAEDRWAEEIKKGTVQEGIVSQIIGDDE